MDANPTTEMSSLPTAENLGGVTQQSSAQQPQGNGSGGGGSGASGNGSASSGGTSSTADSTQSSENDTATTTSITTTTSNTANTTISAAADSSDNQPATPQPPTQILNNTESHQQQQQNVNANTLNANHHPYANHHIYANNPSNAAAANSYNPQVYANSNMDMQQQQQQLQQQQMPQGNYTSYLNSYEQFYQHQQQNQSHPHQHPIQTSSGQMDYLNANSANALLYSNADYKQQQQQQQQQSIVRYHPYLNNPTSQTPASLDTTNPQAVPPVVASSAASSTVMSPRVVSSTSPSSSSNQMPLTVGSSNGGGAGVGGCSNSSMGSPNTNNNTLQCKKCGIMCTNDSELQEHITNVHGASPYGSSGYASSPYIKDDLQQQTPPAQGQQQQQQSTSAANPSDLLDLDAQKLLYHSPSTSANSNNSLMPHQPALSSMAADPLHNLHTMQQRAGLTNWDQQQQQQQQQEGLPPYLHHQQPGPNTNYHSPKHVGYPVSNSSNIMKPTEYPLIKAEYPLDDAEQQQQAAAVYMTDSTVSGPGQQQQQQQQMMPPAVPSSPAEFPSTTTGALQENGQKPYRAGNFEPPSSSSTALTTGPLTGKAANWKSNEARRPKTYNCTACNKWFTSSGHLKRHYNTTLHKNAVKSSGQPDPATMPISVHHHPARDPSAKPSRRAAAAAAANKSQANLNQQHQQQPPNPVQPPEPPNSPHEFAGGPQMAAGGLAPLTHYAATPSPNSMYQLQQQQQHQQHQHYQHQQQYGMQQQQQLQSTTANLSPQQQQHNSAMAGHHYSQHQLHTQQQQQQTVMNGHPNGLAGLSVPTTLATQQQLPMPSSQLRGLLNNTVPTTLVTHTIKTNNSNNNEPMEAATLPEVSSEVQQRLITLSRQNVAEDKGLVRELVYLATHSQTRTRMQTQVKQEVVSPLTTYTPKRELEEQHLPTRQEEAASVVVLKGVDRNAVHHHTTLFNHQQQQQLQSQQQQPYQLLVEQQQQGLERLYHNSTPNSTHSSNTQAHSPITTCLQTYQGQLQHPADQQTPAPPDTYTLTQTPPPQQQQQQLHNIMEQQRFISMRLPTNITQQQQLNNMLPLQQPDTIIRTTPTPTNTPNTLPPPNHQLMQLPQQQSLTELQPLHNIPLQQQQLLLDTSNTNIQHMLPQSLTTTTTNNSIPCFRQLQHQVSAQPALDHTLIYPPRTTIGNTELITFDAYGNLISNQSQQQQIIQTSDGQLLQLITTATTNASEGATTIFSGHNYNPAYVLTQGSPQGGSTVGTMSSLPSHYQFQENSTSSTLTALSPATCYSPNLPTNGYNSPNKEETPPPLNIKQEFSNSMDSTQSTSSGKRKRNSSSSSGSVGASSTMLPNGRIKCLPCDKEFTKICYLTQHNKSFHSGEYPFRCQKCGKRYQEEEPYSIHIDKHKSTDKAHKCELCPKQFHHKTDLRRHVEAIHTGKKQHSCEICEKSFCRKDHLRKHLETHNRQRLVGKKLANKAKNKAGNKGLQLEAQMKFQAQGQAQVQTQSQVHVHNSKNKGGEQQHNSIVNKTSPFSSTPSTPSPRMQIIDDTIVTADNEAENQYEDELESFDSHDISEDGNGAEYTYEQHIQQQEHGHEQEHQQEQDQQHMQMQIIAHTYGDGDAMGENNNTSSVSGSGSGSSRSIYNLVNTAMAIY